jgi:hypothetical protein
MNPLTLAEKLQTIEPAKLVQISLWFGCKDNSINSVLSTYDNLDPCQSHYFLQMVERKRPKNFTTILEWLLLKQMQFETKSIEIKNRTEPVGKIIKDILTKYKTQNIWQDYIDMVYITTILTYYIADDFSKDQFVIYFNQSVEINFHNIALFLLKNEYELFAWPIYEGAFKGEDVLPTLLGYFYSPFTIHQDDNCFKQLLFLGRRYNTDYFGNLKQILIEYINVIDLIKIISAFIPIAPEPLMFT